YVDGDGSDGTVVVKLAADNDSSRNTGVGMGAYLREVAFYQHLGGRLQGPPRCHLAEYDAAEGWFTLVLDDIAGAQQGDQVAGCDVHTARLVMGTLAAVHAAHADVCSRYVTVADAPAADVRAPMGLVHGDFRLDNLLFGAGAQCVVV